MNINHNTPSSDAINIYFVVKLPEIIQLCREDIWLRLRRAVLSVVELLIF